MGDSAITFASGEVSSYYALSAPALKQSGKRWRGACPIHGGGQNSNSFAVRAENGSWFCHSHCGSGGDIISLEMALSGAGFVEARNTVFATIGRALPRRGQATHRGIVEHGQDVKDARLWRRGLPRKLERELDLEKARAFDFTSGEVRSDECIRALTWLESSACKLSGASLVAAYRDAIANHPDQARDVVRQERESEEHAVRIGVYIIRMLESATANRRGGA